ncbi:MAG: sialidase family protein [Actinomycetota bacterium]
MSSRRRVRKLLIVGISALVIAPMLATVASALDLDWSGDEFATQQGQWNWTERASALALTNDGTDDITHLAFASDESDTGQFPSYDCSKNNAVHQGVFHTSSTDYLVTPGDRTRLSQDDMHAQRAALTAYDSYVVAGWITQICYFFYYDHQGTPVAQLPRVPYVRVSADHGETWGTTVKLGGLKGRVDYIDLASSSPGVILASWTNAKNGAILVARSVNSGGTWTIEKVGKTTRRYRTAYGKEGYGGFPGVGIDAGVNGGDDAVVSWIGAKGKLIARVSNNIDAAGDWGPEVVIQPKGVSSHNNFPNLDGVEDRIGLAWTGAFRGKYIEYDGDSDTWGTKNPFLLLPDNTQAPPHVALSSPMPFLNGATDVAIGYGGCEKKPCDTGYYDTAQRIDLMWTFSPSNGDPGSWQTPETVAAAGSCAPTPAQNCYLNELPSGIWADTDGDTDDDQVLVYNRWNVTFTAYLLRRVAGENPTVP